MALFDDFKNIWNERPQVPQFPKGGGKVNPSTTLPLGMTPPDLLSGNPSQPDSGYENENGDWRSIHMNTLQDILESVDQQYYNGHGKPVWNDPRTKNWEFTTQQYFAFLQEMFNRENSDLAYKRQRYETDLAYDRTKFETLYNQYLAAGMSPAAALQAASQSAVTTSGSAPAAPTAGMGSGSSASGSALRDTLGGLSSLLGLGISAANTAQQYKALDEQKRQFDATLGQHQYEFNVNNFDAIQALNGSDDFYGNVAPLFYKRSNKDYTLPLSWMSPDKFTPTEILDTLTPYREEYPDLFNAIEQRKDNPYFQASLRHFLRSELGSRGFAMEQTNLQLRNNMLSTQIHAQEISNRLANFDLSQYKSLIYATLTNTIRNDSAFRESYGIEWRGDDYYFPEVFLNDGTALSNVRLTDYINYMQDGFISNASLQGLSFNDIIRLKSDYMSLTLQTDPDLFAKNLATMKNNASVAQNMSALDFLVSQSIYGDLNDSSSLGTFCTWKTYLDMTGISSAAKWTSEQAIKLYGVKSMNKNAANRLRQDQTHFEQSLEQRSYGVNGYSVSY